MSAFLDRMSPALQCQQTMAENHDTSLKKADTEGWQPEQVSSLPVFEGGRAEGKQPSSIPIGALLNHTYRIERLLGSGGMGEVYLARHSELGTRHAIKVIRPELFSNEQALELFRREAAVLRSVRDDAVVSYDGFFRDKHGRNYLVMEYVEGVSLSDLLRRGRLSVTDVYVLRDRLASGLAVAHAQGAAHRDISPDNVILPQGRMENAKLIDFGLCKLTDPLSQTLIGSTFAGKYLYVSPEQLGMFGGIVDGRSDIYSLGLVMAAAGLGRPVYMGDSFEAVRAARQVVPDLSSLPQVLQEQITAMVQPLPEDRPQSLTELVWRWPAPPTASAVPTRILPRFPAAAGAEPRQRADTGSQPWPVWLALGIASLALLAGGVHWFVDSEPLAKGDVEMPSASKRLEASQSLSIAQIARLPWERVERYFHEYLVRGRVDKAFDLLEEAAQAGHTLPAQPTYAFGQQLLTLGRPEEAFLLFRELGPKGHAPSSLALGEMLDPRLWSGERSAFGQPNARQAEKWYHRALTQGSVSARARLDELAQWQQEHLDQVDYGR